MTETAEGAASAVPWQEARLVEVAPRTPTIRSFVFQLPRPFVHRPGQHVDLRLTAPDGYTAQRSYSIASAPDGSDRIELAIERLEGGEVSSFLHDVAEVGDDIELRGPLGGHFVWSAEDGGPLLLIGGGSGLVPLMAMLRHRRLSGSGLPAALVQSARRRDDVLYGDELREMAEADDGFALVLTLTRAAHVEAGTHGRRVDRDMVAEALARLPGPPAEVFICGSNAFVGAAADAAVAAGLDPARIRTERYGE